MPSIPCLKVYAFAAVVGNMEMDWSMHASGENKNWFQISYIETAVAWWSKGTVGISNSDNNSLWRW
jgi:hypothetical protein